jgi:opacity protein-like surface antigen
MTSRKRRRSIVVAISACAAVLVCAAAALAVLPKQGKYTGESSQGRKTVVKANSNGRITYFKQNWKAPCGGGKHWGPDGTEDIDGTKDKIKQDGTGEFHDKGSYSSQPDSNGYIGHFKVRLNGKFTSKTKANGEFDIKVHVTRNGNSVDDCHAHVTWHVSN